MGQKARLKGQRRRCREEEDESMEGIAMKHERLVDEEMQKHGPTSEEDKECARRWWAVQVQLYKHMAPWNGSERQIRHAIFSLRMRMQLDTKRPLKMATVVRGEENYEAYERDRVTGKEKVLYTVKEGIVSYT